ncbi:MAG: Hsp33 family molecular chaperone HslO [Leptonema sp. (in: Bacteria)]|nr:Hsp33 family molecular chaperone HslO [Leptonema sp. (in: bacteria)]
MTTDVYYRGILNDLNYRYVIASAFDSVNEVWFRHKIKQAQSAVLLGEAVMAAFLLAARGTKELNQTISLHFECNGPIRRLMATGRFDGGVRGYTPESEASWNGSLYHGKGTGLLNVSRFLYNSKKIYSSSIEFQEQPLSKDIEDFLAKSEQVQVFIQIGAFEKSNSYGIYGMLFEALPDATADQTDNLIDYLQKPIFNEFTQTGSLPKLPGQLEQGRLFHHCGCNREKISQLLTTIGEDECRSILSENGKIEVTCEFCREQYLFYEPDLQRIFVDHSV